MPTRQQLNTTPLRTISDFKSRLSGGGARPNLFEVELAFPDAVAIDNDVLQKARFLVKAAALPASTIAPIDVPFRGRILKIAGDRTFETWTITVINDTDFSLRSAFEKWMNTINKMNKIQILRISTKTKKDLSHNNQNPKLVYTSNFLILILI